MTDLIAKANRAFCTFFFSLALALSCIPVSAIVAPRAYADDTQETAPQELTTNDDELLDEPEANAADLEQTTDEAQDIDPEPIAAALEDAAATSLTPQDDPEVIDVLLDSGTFDGGQGTWEYHKMSTTDTTLNYDYVLFINTAGGAKDSALSLAEINNSTTGWGKYKAPPSGAPEADPQCITKIFFGNANNGTVKLPENSSSLFSGYTKLRSIDFGTVVDASDVTDMSRMFKNCKKLKNITINPLKSNKLTNMSEMFMYCTELASISMIEFNTQNVTDMSNLFCQCKALKSLVLNNFRTPNVTDMSGMFQECAVIDTLDLSYFDTKNVTDMSYMFYECDNLRKLDLSKFDTSKVTDMAYMFCDCSNLMELNVSSFDTSNVTNMENMFQCCSEITSLGLSGFKTPKVTNFTSMFEECNALRELNLTNFDTSNATKMQDMLTFNYRNFKSLIVGDKFSFTGAATDPSEYATIPDIGIYGLTGWYSAASGKEYKLFEDVIKEQQTLGTSGNAYFTTPINLSDIQEYIVIEPVTAQYTYTPGVAAHPEPVVTLMGFGNNDTFRYNQAYTFEYSDNMNASVDGKRAQLWITGMGSFKGSTENKPVYFDIKPQPIDGGAILIDGKGPVGQGGNSIAQGNTYELTDQPYTGSPITPKPKITFNGTELILGTDYIINYGDNTDPGKAFLTVKGFGNYSGQVRANFQIVGDDPQSPPANTTNVKAPTVSGTWKKSGNRWWFSYDSATKLAQKKDWPANEWATIGGKRYYFNSGGWMSTGWLKLANNWYYLGSDGALKTGWVRVGSRWYYTEKTNGVMQTGWFTDTDGKKYFLDTSGSGHMKTGWQKISGKWYFFTAAGNMLYKWQRVGGKWYYLDAKTGAMQTGLLKDGNTEYYLNSPNGDMATGWKQIKTTDDKGKATTNWYYFGSSGAMLKNAWRYEGGKWYYLGAGGSMLTGTQKIGDDTYFFSTSGVMHKGWNQEGSNWYYYDSSGARIKDKWLKSGGYWYHFSKSTGAMQTNWYTDDNGNSYFLHDGKMIADAHISLDDGITGKKYYYFDPSGAMVKNKWVNNYYYGKDGARLFKQWVDDTHYVGDDGKWDPTAKR